MNNLQQTIIERYTEKKFKSKDFTYREYLNLRKKLTDRNIKDGQSIAKTEQQVEKINNLPDKRFVSFKTYDDILLSTTLATLSATAVATTLAGCEPVNIAGGSLAGALVGTLAGHANVIAYQNKPLTKAICKAVVKSKDRKLKRLCHRQELRDYTLYCFRQQERDNTPSYEDFVKAVENLDNGIEM